MGNSPSPERVNFVYENVKKLEAIGIPIKKEYDITDIIFLKDKNLKKEIINLYKTFYYPTHSLTKVEECTSHFGGDTHHHLRRILTNNIELYNKYNSTNINVNNYVKNTLENLQPTLRVIGV